MKNKKSCSKICIYARFVVPLHRDSIEGTSKRSPRRLKNNLYWTIDSERYDFKTRPDKLD